MIPHRPSLLARIARWLSAVLSIGVLLSSLTGDNSPIHGGLALDPENGSTSGTPVDERKTESPIGRGSVGSAKQGRETYSAEQRFKSCNREPISDYQRFMMVVSTMDGKVTALNGLDGLMQWSLSTGTGPLLSSSISQLVSTRDGMPARLIPALDGSLYQLDVDGIEPVPLSADMLLSSSYRFSEDSMVVGGKDIETYALDLSAGKVLYMCSSAGCKYFDSRTTTEGAGRGFDGGQRFGSRASIVPDTDVLIVKRTGKTVRAVDILSGLEKWNYSVAQHDVTYLRRSGYQHNNGPSADEYRQHTGPTSAEHRHNCHQPWTADSEDDASYRDATVEDVLDDAGHRYGWSFNSDTALPDPSDIDLKVIVPSGQILAVSRSNPEVVYWRYKFETSIASAWMVNGHSLTDISLFDGQRVPALDHNPRLGVDDPIPTSPPNWSNEGESSSTDMSNPVTETLPPQPVIYVGTYNNQLYVQPSVRLIAEIEEAELEAARRRGQVSAISMPRVRWKPYIATAPSRTPIVSESGGPLLIEADVEEELSVETALAPWHEQYPFDTGYYLYSDYTPIRLPMIDSDSMAHNNEDGIGVSLLNWWKEVAAISILTSIFLHLTCHILVRRIYPRRRNCGLEAGVARQGSSFYEAAIEQSQEKRSKHSSECEIERERSKAGSSDSRGESRNASTSDQVDYISRYMTDFEQKACLGRGGFGVVFSVVNRLDDCEYAIKRITLTDSEIAREKVMREVKALAKLDHPGIVRYYQSWFERPPPGWQEQIDKICINLSLATPTNGLYPSSITSIGSTDIGGNGDCSRPPKAAAPTANPGGYNPFRPFDVFNGQLEANFSDSQSFSEQENGTRSDVILDITSTCDSSHTGAEVSRRIGRCSTRAKNLADDSSDDEISCSEDGDKRIDDDDESSSLDSGFSLRHTSCNRNDNTARSSLDRFAADDDSLEISFRDESVSDRNDKSQKINISTSSRRNCQLARSMDATASTRSDDSFIVVFSNDISKSRTTETPSVGTTGVERSLGSTSRSKSAPVNRPISLSLSPDTISTNQERDKCKKDSSTNERDKCKGDLAKALIDSSVMGKGPPPAKLYLYIQMQLCRTDSLKDWLNNNTLNRDRTQLIDMFYQIVSAINYVHDSGLMHRDLKPSNIFFAMNGSVKIGDFGLVTAAVTEGEVGVTSLVTPMMSHHHMVGGKHTDQVGTQLYMSPEQCAGLAYTHKVDIYALGMIFFELFYPFSTQMERIDTLRGVRLLRFPQRFTRELTAQYEFVKRLLSHTPTERPSTQEILEDPLLQDLEIERNTQQRYQRQRNSSSSGSTVSNNSQNSICPLIVDSTVSSVAKNPQNLISRPSLVSTISSVSRNSQNISSSSVNGSGSSVFYENNFNGNNDNLTAAATAPADFNNSRIPATAASTVATVEAAAPVEVTNPGTVVSTAAAAAEADNIATATIVSAAIAAATIDSAILPTMDMEAVAAITATSTVDQ